MRKTGLFWIVGLLLLAGRGMTQDLAEPIRILSVGKPIDTEVGHAAPFMCDYDGDGVQDLLVGQFKGGCLWLYHNEGTNQVPKLTSGFKFKQGTDSPVNTRPTVGFGCFYANHRVKHTEY